DTAQRHATCGDFGRWLWCGAFVVPCQCKRQPLQFANCFGPHVVSRCWFLTYCKRPNKARMACGHSLVPHRGNIRSRELSVPSMQPVMRKNDEWLPFNSLDGPRFLGDCCHICPGGCGRETGPARTRRCQD